MAKDVVLRVQHENNGNNTLIDENFTALEILTSLCLLCGILQVIHLKFDWIQKLYIN